MDAIIKWGREKEQTLREENTERRFEGGKSGESEGLPGRRQEFRGAARLCDESHPCRLGVGQFSLRQL